MRAPSGEELATSNVHLAIGGFEMGSLDLDEEEAVNLSVAAWTERGFWRVGCLRMECETRVIGGWDGLCPATMTAQASCGHPMRSAHACITGRRLSSRSSRA